jgi:hypothetical protein
MTSRNKQNTAFKERLDIIINLNQYKNTLKTNIEKLNNFNRLLEGLLSETKYEPVLLLFKPLVKYYDDLLKNTKTENESLFKIIDDLISYINNTPNLDEIKKKYTVSETEFNTKINTLFKKVDNIERALNDFANIIERYKNDYNNITQTGNIYIEDGDKYFADYVTRVKITEALNNAYFKYSEHDIDELEKYLKLDTILDDDNIKIVDSIINKDETKQLIDRWEFYKTKVDGFNNNKLRHVQNFVKSFNDLEKYISRLKNHKKTIPSKTEPTRRGNMRVKYINSLFNDGKINPKELAKYKQIISDILKHDDIKDENKLEEILSQEEKDTFKANQAALEQKGIKIDDFEDVAKVSTKTVGKINKYTPDEIEEANKLRLSPIFAYMLWYNIKKNALLFFDTIIYQLNILYANEFSYYEFFLIVIFMTLILVVGIILYWDNVYRTAKKLSRCSKINMIAYQNRDKDNYPFVYVIMIINESNLDAVLDKYVLKLEYNFVKKTTNAILGESEYINEVLLSDEVNSNISTKKAAYDTAFTAYDTANKDYPASIIELKTCEDNFAVNCKDFKKDNGDICPYNNVCATNCIKYDEGCKRQITQYEAKLTAQNTLAAAESALNGAKNLLSAELAKSQFTYFDLGRMQSKKLESINKDLITDRKYKYICMTPDNKILKTEIARELATFVRDFGMNDKTDIYPLNSVLTAVEKSKELNV